MRPSRLFTPRGRPASSVSSRQSLCLLLFSLTHDYTGETQRRQSLMRNFVEFDLELFSRAGHRFWPCPKTFVDLHGSQILLTDDVQLGVCHTFLRYVFFFFFFKADRSRSYRLAGCRFTTTKHFRSRGGSYECRCFSSTRKHI